MKNQKGIIRVTYMKSPLISVILPVYNVSNYLNRCLRSVVNQTYRNLEIIIVNDGSTDNSLSIVTKWSQRDKRIKVVSQNNKGLSAARNSGISVANGKYLTFIDSDDYVTNDYVEYLYSLLARNNFKSKLSICSLYDVYSDSNKIVNMGNGATETLSGKKCLQMMCYHDLVDTCAYAKLGEKTLYDDNFFPEGKLFEDIGSTYKLFEQCSTVECGFQPKYFYVIRKNSIVTSNFSPAKMDLIEMTDQMSESVTSIYPELKAATARRQSYARFSTLNQTLSGGKQVKPIQRELVNYLVKHKKEVLADPLTPKRDRVAYKMLSFGLPIYSFCWKTYLKLKK